MSNPNRPYVLELAAMIHDRQERINAGVNVSASMEHRTLVAAADRNGVSRGQLRDAIAEVASLGLGPDALQAWLRGTYLLDGREKGYVGPDDEPPMWVLAQLAHAYYTRNMGA